MRALSTSLNIGFGYDTRAEWVEAKRLTPGCVALVGTLEKLLAGDYAGSVAFEDLVPHGDHGLGTAHDLDGEIVGDATGIYQIRTDGIPRSVPPKTTTPFAAWTHFRKSGSFTFETPGSLRDYADFRSWLDRKLGNLKFAYAVQIHGAADTVKARSVPAQCQPYPDFAQVSRAQTFFDHVDEVFTMVGYRFPENLNGIARTPDEAGSYHLHGRVGEGGGHILGFEGMRAVVDVMPIASFVSVYPNF